jgi:hypothetical protein
MTPYPWTTFLTLAAVMMAVASLISLRRRNALRQFAFQHGFEYRPTATPEDVGITQTTFFEKNSTCCNLISGNLWQGSFPRSITADLRRLGQPQAPASSTAFLYFEHVVDHLDYGSKIESVVRFPVASGRARSVPWWREDEEGYRLDIAGQYIFVWQKGKQVPAHAVADFILSANAASRPYNEAPAT